jgi:hypothetical protein
VKREAIAIGKYRARPSDDAAIDRAIQRAFRRAILAKLNAMSERMAGMIWGPYLRYRAMMYEAACEAMTVYVEWLRREIEEQIAGKMSEIWEPER